MVVAGIAALHDADWCARREIAWDMAPEGVPPATAEGINDARIKGRARVPVA